MVQITSVIPKMQNKINTYKYSQGSEFIKVQRNNSKSQNRNLSPASNGENAQFHVDDVDEKLDNEDSMMN